MHDRTVTDEARMSSAVAAYEDAIQAARRHGRGRSESDIKQMLHREFADRRIPLPGEETIAALTRSIRQPFWPLLHPLTLLREARASKRRGDRRASP